MELNETIVTMIIHLSYRIICSRKSVAYLAAGAILVFRCYVWVTSWQHLWLCIQLEPTMNAVKLVIPLHFIPRKKKTTNDAVTPLCQSQFTPKMKANAVPRLLSSLV